MDKSEYYIIPLKNFPFCLIFGHFGTSSIKTSKKLSFFTHIWYKTRLKNYIAQKRPKMVSFDLLRAS